MLKQSSLTFSNWSRKWITFGNVLLILIIVGLLYLIAPYREISQPNGILVRDPPIQSALWKKTGVSMRYMGFDVTPLANYDVSARVLARHNYNDDVVDLSSLDLLLGWGAMSDSARLEHMDISCNWRYCTIMTDRYSDLKEMKGTMANTHTIPMTSKVKRELDALRVGNVVRLKGYLVSVTRPDGFNWTSSLRRDDSGYGACEVMLVTEVIILS